MLAGVSLGFLPAYSIMRNEELGMRNGGGVYTVLIAPVGAMPLS